MKHLDQKRSHLQERNELKVIWALISSNSYQEQTKTKFHDVENENSKPVKQYLYKMNLPIQEFL